MRGFRGDYLAIGKPLAQIEAALDQLLTRLLKERAQATKKRIASGQPLSFRAYSAAELIAMPILSDQEVWRQRIIKRPIAGALEWAISEIGEVLFQRGGTDLMRDGLERVARRHRKTYGQRVSILDVTWDGIGGKWWH
jgi:hypothetical protein